MYFKCNWKYFEWMSFIEQTKSKQTHFSPGIFPPWVCILEMQDELSVITGLFEMRLIKQVQKDQSEYVNKKEVRSLPN